MKIKLVSFLAILFISTLVNGQSFRFGTITADAGVGFGIYGIKAHSPVNGNDVSGISFVGTLPSIKAEFGLLKFLGVGGYYRRGTYGKGGGGKGRGNDIGLTLNFHLANKKDKFDLPIGVTLGTTSLYLPLSSTQSFSGNGTLINIHVSPHIYFSKYLGIFLSLGYNKHVLTNIKTIDGGKTYTQAEGATWKMGGVYFEFGIAGRFHSLNRDPPKTKE